MILSLLKSLFCRRRQSSLLKATRKKKEKTSVDLESCGRRLRSLYDAWSDAKTAAFFNGAECVLLGSGANKEEELRYLKAVSLETFGCCVLYRITVIAFVKKDGDDANEMHAIASGKKAKLLESARETIESSIKGKLTVHVKPAKTRRRRRRSAG